MNGQLIMALRDTLLALDADMARAASDPLTRYSSFPSFLSSGTPLCSYQRNTSTMPICTGCPVHCGFAAFDGHAAVNAMDKPRLLAAFQRRRADLHKALWEELRK